LRKPQCGEQFVTGQVRCRTRVRAQRWQRVQWSTTGSDHYQNVLLGERTQRRCDGLSIVDVGDRALGDVDDGLGLVEVGPATPVGHRERHGLAVHRAMNVVD
jgi:hypothetical protein